MSSPFHPRRPLCVSRAILPALTGAIAVLALPASSEAGQALIITGSVDYPVAGNGVFGNQSDLLPDLNDNTVIVPTTGNATLGVSGSYVSSDSASVTASGNSVIIENGGRASGGVFGAQIRSYTGSATASDNTVTANGATVGSVDSTGAIYGGSANGSINASAIGNSVTINGTTVWGDINGGRSSVDTSSSGTAEATGNSVTISGGSVVGGNIYGGYVVYDGSSSARVIATGNTVTISGTPTLDGSLYGGYVAGNGDATGNAVTINGGTLSLSSGIYGGFTQNGNATGNAITVSGGEDIGIIYGGYTQNGNATHNTVTISGTTSIGALYGGYTPGYDAFTGNTLNLKTADLTVGMLTNFEYLNFYLPATMMAGETMLVVNGAAYIDGATVNVGIDGTSSALGVGDSVTLIQASTLNGTLANSTANGYGMQGVTLQYVFDLDTTTTANSLIAKVASVGATEESKALSEGFVSGTALVNQGADMAAGEGMARAVAAGATGGSFGAIGGGSVRTNTGSHVDVDGVSLMAGFAGGQQLDAGRLTLGGFVEYGTGSYDTYNAFSGSTVRGSGDSDYIGAGLLGRMEFTATGAGTPYAEGSVRGGRASNDYGADFSGRWSAYESASAYYGLHVGTGYVWNLDERTSLDLSAKYFWTHQDGDTVHLSTGDTVRFEDVDSQRLRIGGRLSYAFNQYVSPYAGAAFEHEFDGKARASTNGIALDAPSLAGNTGILEAGLTLTPSPDLPLSLDLGLQGYFGKREGIAGSLKLKLEL